MPRPLPPLPAPPASLALVPRQARHDRLDLPDPNDATAIQWMATDTITSFVTSAFTLIAMLYVTARIDWVLALVALAVAPPLSIISLVYRRRLRFQQVRVKRLESGRCRSRRRRSARHGSSAPSGRRSMRHGDSTAASETACGLESNTSFSRAGGAARRHDHRHRDRGRALRGRTLRSSPA